MFGFVLEIATFVALDDLTFDRNQVAATFGKTLDVFAESIDELAPLIDEGIVELNGAEIVVVPQWRALTRLVCAAFDTYLDCRTGRHALAV